MKLKIIILAICFIITSAALFSIISIKTAFWIIFIAFTAVVVISVLEEIFLRKDLKKFSEIFDKMQKGDFTARIFLKPENILFNSASDLNALTRQLEGIVKDQVDKSWELYKWNMNLGGIIEKKESELKEVEQDLNQLEEKNKMLDKITKTDGLTQLYNHKYIYERLEQEILKAKSFEKGLSIVMFDIDHFKHINDNYGHQEGDKVIVAVANTLKTQCRKYDILGRYGGEEFLAILPNTNIDGAMLTAERIRKRVEMLEFDSGIKITISGGVAEYNDENALTLVKKADNLLYVAKESGRNRIEK